MNPLTTTPADPAHPYCECSRTRQAWLPGHDDYEVCHDCDAACELCGAVLKRATAFQDGTAYFCAESQPCIDRSLARARRSFEASQRILGVRGAA